MRHVPFSRARTRYLFLAALVVPTVASAQPGGDKSAEKDCDKAAKIVAKGHPEKKEAWAFLTLSTCGATAADAFVTGLSHYTYESDPLVLEEFMHQVDNWRDGRIFEAVMSLATNSAAAAPARVFAVRHLLILTHPFLRYPYAGLIVGEVTTSDADLVKTTIGCREAFVSVAANRVAYPLAPDYAALIESTLASLSASASTPTIVRNAARCAN